jgi:acetyl-CoA synthetase
MNFPFQIKSIDEYKAQYWRSLDEPEQFWSEIAASFQWKKPWTQVLDWNFEEPRVEWFAGGKLNITENCLDRHLESRGDEIALIWEPNDSLKDDAKTFTYNQLHEEVMRFAAVLKSNGVKKGDRVCIYLGMIPELAVAMLACARIGAIHSVIFGGFSAQSIADRLQDAGAEVIITADGAFRGNKVVPLKSVIDDALPTCPFVRKVIVITRTQTPVSMIRDRDVWLDVELKNVQALGDSYVAAEEMDAEDPLFILYTSGSTGKPKGVVHSVAGYMLWTAYTFINTFQVQPDDVHFCTADIGWITGHSYIVYAPLCAGTTTVIFEGTPTWPDAGRFWEVVEKHRANILYTSPTAIRSLMAYGTDLIKSFNLDSLRVLGTVGEPINEEAWHWYDEHIGQKRCPIVDTWWQTETGGTMISNLAGVTPSKPGYATLPMPGVFAALVDENGNILEGNNQRGNLCIRAPWPSIIRTTWGDHERCRTAYFTAYPGMYFTGDGALRDEEGYYRITGRVDDVLNVSGHRIGTAELENALNQHAGVIESAVVGYPHVLKGQGVYAFIVLSHDTENEELSRQDILQTVTRLIGPIAKPDKIQFVNGLPKTRSGKIMRRILRKIAEGETEEIGDTTTLLDPGVVEEILKGRL